MIMKYVYLACVLMMTLSSCSNKKRASWDDNVNATQFIVESINNRLDLSHRVSSMSFIALNDSISNALFKSIDKCIFKDGKIFILDYWGTSSVKVFDLKGNFLFNVGSQGNGPQEYYKVIDFDVTEDAIYLLDSKLRKILCFDLNGSFIDEYSYNNKIAGINGLIVTLDGNFLLGMDVNINMEHQVVLTDKEFDIKQQILSVDSLTTKGHLNIGSFKRCGDQIVYNYPVSDYIYIFDNNGSINYKYEVLLGDNAVSDDLKCDYQKISIAKRQGQKISYFNEIPFMSGNLLITTMYSNSNKALFCLDVKEKASYLKEYKIGSLSFSLSDFNFPIYADEHQVVCLVNQMVYEYLDESSKQKIDEDMLKHLEEGGHVLIVYQLN